MIPTSKITGIGAVAILIILIIGMFCMDMNVKNEYSLEYGEDGLSYEIDLGYVSNYSVVSFDDGGLGRNQKFVACFDHEHVWFKSDEYIGNTLEHLVNDMSERGLTLTVTGTDAVVELIESDIANGTSDTTVVFVTGSLPEELWNGSDDSLIIQWLEIGGDIVWGSGPLGFNISYSDRCESVDTDPGFVFYGVEGAIHNGMTRSYDNNSHPEGIADLFRIYFSETTWGILAGVSEDQLVTEHMNDGYAAVSVTKYYDGSGSIAVFGGDVDNNMTGYLAQFMASGLGYGSVIVDYDLGIGKQASGTLNVSTDNPAAFLCLGMVSDNLVLYLDCDSEETVERAH